MSNHTMSRALEIALFWILVTAPGVSSQMPTRPGKLHVTSTPQGETITINGTRRPEVTDVTLVVSPGAYKVSIGDCKEQSVQVSSGETKEVQCPPETPPR
jgi:hypothetical protein